MPMNEVILKIDVEGSECKVWGTDDYLFWNK